MPGSTQAPRPFDEGLSEVANRLRSSVLGGAPAVNARVPSASSASAASTSSTRWMPARDEVARRACDRLRGGRRDVERRVGRHHHDRAAIRAIDLHVGEHLRLRGEQRAQALRVDERGPDPLHEHAGGLEP